MDRVLVGRRKDGGMGEVRSVETSVETSSGEGVDSGKNLDAVGGGEKLGCS